MYSLNFTSHLLLLPWCSLAFTGTVIAVTSLLVARGKRAVSIFVSAMVLLLGFGSLVGIAGTMPVNYKQWIAVLPNYLGVVCIRVLSRAGDRRVEFRVSTLLGVVALIDGHARFG